MIFSTVKIKGTEYKLRMTGKSMIEVEKKIGKNPINALMKAVDGEMPLMSDMIAVFWGALLPLNANISFDAAADIYTDYIDDGNTFNDFIFLMLDILRTSGFISEDNQENEESTDTEKN